MAEKKDFGAAFNEYAAGREKREPSPLDRIVTNDLSDEVPDNGFDSTRISFRLPESLKQDFIKAAAADGLKLSSGIKYVMTQYVNEWRRKGGR